MVVVVVLVVARKNGGDKLQRSGGSDDDDDDEEEEEVVGATHDDENACLFAGKNFVFDQRRYDPVVGRNDVRVGQCVICACHWTDYDNGHAPCENKEARCCRCRVLVLVCNDCRTKVRIWGEELDDGVVVEGGDEGQRKKPDLFCDASRCINEGNEVNHCELRTYNE